MTKESGFVEIGKEWISDILRIIQHGTEETGGYRATITYLFVRNSEL